MIKWNEDQIELKESISKWADKLSEDHIELEDRNEFSFDRWRVICEIGIPSLPIADEYGGLGQDILTTMFVLEELGRASENAGLNFVTSSHIVSAEIPIQTFGTNYQREKYLPQLCEGKMIGAHAISEPDGGSDAFNNMRTRAVKDGNRYILNGSKVFISNAPIADIFVIYAVTDKSKGTLGGISAFLVEKSCPGLSIGKPTSKMGLSTAPMSEVYLNNCELSPENFLGKIGHGFSIFNYVMKWEILCSFIINVGEMERQLNKCIQYSKERKQFGSPISKYQSISNMIADMKIGLEASRTLLYRAGLRFQEGVGNVAMDIAIAKVVTSEHYVKSSLNAIQIFGGYGYMKEYGIEKDLRNAVAGKIYSGSSEIQRNIIAALLGL